MDRGGFNFALGARTGILGTISQGDWFWRSAMREVCGNSFGDFMVRKQVCSISYGEN